VISPTETGSRSVSFAHIERVLKLASAGPLWLHRGVLGVIGSQFKRLMGVAGAVVRRAVAPAGERAARSEAWCSI
jgi:hypothetical protein